MLPDDLAEAIPHGATAVPIARLWRKFLGTSGCFRQLGTRSDLFDRADSDAVGLTKSSIDGTSFSDAHLGSVHEVRDIRGIGVTIAVEALAGLGFVYRGFKCPAVS